MRVYAEALKVVGSDLGLIVKLFILFPKQSQKITTKGVDSV